jgi:hypothetical protein
VCIVFLILCYCVCNFVLCIVLSVCVCVVLCFLCIVVSVPPGTNSFAVNNNNNNNNNNTEIRWGSSDLYYKRTLSVTITALTLLCKA